MSVLYTNNASATLSASITNAATSFSVSAGQGALFPAITGSDFFYVTLTNTAGTVEIVKVTARTTDTFTVVRGQDGTSAVAWSSGDKVELRVTKAMLDQFKTDTQAGITSSNVTTALGFTPYNSTNPNGYTSNTGDVLGPASSGDKAIARFSGTGGKTIQNSSASIDDSGNISATSSAASGTAANKMPVGTTAQRPASPVTGMYRMNSTTQTPEWYDVVTNTWVSFDAAPYRPYTAEVLMVAGGGGGGNSGANYCGGGGAGGCLYFGSSNSTNTSGTVKTPNGSAKTISPLTSYSIVIGAGGGAESTGSNTTAFGETALGGGWGRGNAYAASGGSGGSGGGGTAYYGAGGAGTSGQGYAGGYGATANQGGQDSGAGGGGGAQQNGSGGQYSNSANAGGQGVQYDISGSAAFYAAGGTGSGFYAGSNTNGIGGSVYGGSTASGVVNTGSGGGGGRYGGGGGGGSGVVIIRYQGAQRGSGGTVSTMTIGGVLYTIHKFTSSGTFVG